MRKAGLEEAQAGIKIAGRTINNMVICKWQHPSGRKWRGTKAPLDESVKESENVGFKLNIQETKIMASVPLHHGR